jgi:hypothetical protein
MLGYGDVRMNYSPSTQPIRTLQPGMRIADNPDNAGALGYGSGVNDPLRADHGDGDLRQSNFTYGRPMFGIDYARAANGDKGTGDDKTDFTQKYTSPLAQAQKLRRNVHFNLQGITRRIVTPDIQTQFETGYTLPLQQFAFISSKLWNTPAGKNVAGSMMSSQQPSLKRSAPTASIPTAMPWNVSAPGQTY